jgi:hypothetical protein
MKKRIPKRTRRQSYLCSWSKDMDSDQRRILARSIGEAAECYYRQTCADDTPEHGNSIGDVYVRCPRGDLHWMVVSADWVLDVFARPAGAP